MAAPTKPDSGRARAAPTEDVVVRDQRPSIPAMLSETWAYRGLIPRLGLRQIIKGFAGTKLGRAWLILRPLVGLFGMTLLFGSILQAPSEGVPYLLFLLVGLLAWMAVERTVFWGTRSFDIYRKVAGRLDVPALLVPTAATAPMALEVLIMAAIMVATAIYYTIADGAFLLEHDASLLVAAAGFLLAVLLGWSISLWLGTLNAMARDVRQVVRFALPVWLYVTPVIYPVSSLPEGWGWLGEVNPATAPVEMVRHGLLGVGSVQGDALAVSLATTLVVCVTGLWFVRHRAPFVFRDSAYVDLEDEF